MEQAFQPATPTFLSALVSAITRRLVAAVVLYYTSLNSSPAAKISSFLWSRPSRGRLFLLFVFSAPQRLLFNPPVVWLRLRCSVGQPILAAAAFQAAHSRCLSVHLFLGSALQRCRSLTRRFGIRTGLLQCDVYCCCGGLSLISMVFSSSSTTKTLPKVW